MPRCLPERTNEKNLDLRLFFRFFVCYFCCFAFSFSALTNVLPAPDATRFGMNSFLMILLAILGAVLTLTKPYLLLLTLTKSFFDAATLHFVAARLRIAGGFWSFNAWLFYLVFSLLLFCAAAARACRFSAESTARDAALLFSRRFFCFCGEALLLIALGAILYVIWPQLYLLL